MGLRDQNTDTSWTASVAVFSCEWIRVGRLNNKAGLVKTIP
jgi:hypothetical protein